MGRRARRGALAAALRGMPALRALLLRGVEIGAAPAAALFRGGSTPRLRFLEIVPGLAPAGARALAAAGWPFEELVLNGNADLGADGVAALVAAPSLALRRLDLRGCNLDAA